MATSLAQAMGGVPVQGGVETSGIEHDKEASGTGMASQFRTPKGHKTSGGFSAGNQNNTPSKLLSPLPAMVQSPAQDFLSPNDDQLERARLRAARIEQRRRSIHPDSHMSAETDSDPLQSQEDANILNIDALSAMLQNCLKMSAANKINQGNTWDLHLIDHLSELVKNDSDIDAQTNFQLASCTLETGVKIYSFRVDSVHAGTYKLLGGLSRSAHEQAAPELHTEDGDEGGPCPKPASAANRKGGTDTLTSYDTITLKKFSEAFNVDPLFHQVSAQFDEGGARGLLLVNLSVYPGCEIIFQSSEKPEISMKAEAAKVEDGSDTLDFSIVKDQVKRILDVLSQDPQMTPTLKEIAKLIDDPHRAAFECETGRACPATRNPCPSTPPSSCFDTAEDCDPGEVFNEPDDQFTDMNSEGCNEASPGSVSWSENTGVQDQEDFDDDRDGLDDEFLCDDGLGWLAMASGIPVKSNAWAGPEHWKFPKAKEESKSSEADNEKKEKKTKRKKKVPLWNEFETERLPEFDDESTRSINLPQRMVPLACKLPNDHCYSALCLAKTCFRSPIITRSKKEPEQVPSAEYFENEHEETRWDEYDQPEPLGDEEDGTGHSDVDDPVDVDLVPMPRKVQQIDVTYDKSAKQVDVRLLKCSLWEQLEHASPESNQEEEYTENGLSFQQVLRCFPEDCPAAAPADISVHLCFICLLHLANEHCLRIDDCSTMDDLRIFCVRDDSKVVA